MEFHTLEESMAPETPNTTHQVSAEAHRQQVILEINNNIASNLDLYDLLRSVSASVRNALCCDAAGISIPEGEHLRLYTLDFPGAVGAAREGVLIPIKGSMLGEVFAAGKAA